MARPRSGTPYFTENPGDPFKAWDISATVRLHAHAVRHVRLEYNHRAANVPYFSGPGGMTPPGGIKAIRVQFVPGWDA